MRWVHVFSDDFDNVLQEVVDRTQTQAVRLRASAKSDRSTAAVMRGPRHDGECCVTESGRMGGGGRL